MLDAGNMAASSGLCDHAAVLAQSAANWAKNAIADTPKSQHTDKARKQELKRRREKGIWEETQRSR